MALWDLQAVNVPVMVFLEGVTLESAGLDALTSVGGMSVDDHVKVALNCDREQDNNGFIVKEYSAD